MENWFEYRIINERICIIRERLDQIDPRYHTTYTNMYLIKGSHTAILLDTGCGYQPIRPVVDDLLGGLDLLVINSHNHWDHIGGNGEFEETYIHRLDFKKLMSPMDISFLRSSPSPRISKFETSNFTLSFSETNIPLVGDEIFNLGGLEISLMRTHGHTPGSISLISSEGDLFTGDTYHYGAYFLPPDHIIPDLIASLDQLLNLKDEFPSINVYPGHEKYLIDLNNVSNLINAISNLEPSDEIVDQFLEAKIYDRDPFLLIQSVQDVN